jgi:hypothetical protein
MKVPGWSVPLLIVLVTLAGLGAAELFAIPSVTVDYPASGDGGDGSRATTTLLVEGVKCVDTAQNAAGALNDTPGVVRFVAYASRNKVEITYDPTLTDPEQICEALEGPVLDEEAGEYYFNLFEVVEIDGEKVSE